VIGNDEFAAFAQRIVRAHGRRVAEGDVEALADLAALRECVDRAMQDAVDGLRFDHDYSWSDIGRVLNTTRQAAQMRYGKTTTKQGAPA